MSNVGPQLASGVEPFQYGPAKVHFVRGGKKEGLALEKLVDLFLNRLAIPGCRISAQHALDAVRDGFSRHSLDERAHFEAVRENGYLLERRRTDGTHCFFFAFNGKCEVSII